MRDTKGIPISMVVHLQWQRESDVFQTNETNWPRYKSESKKGIQNQLTWSRGAWRARACGFLGITSIRGKMYYWTKLESDVLTY